MQNDVKSGAALDKLFADLPDNFQRSVPVLLEIDSIYVEIERDHLLEHNLNILVRNLFVNIERARRRDASTDRDEKKPYEEMSEAERLREMTGMFLIGESGAGKSAALEHLFKKRFDGFCVPGSGCPLISVSLRGACTLETVAKEVLRQLGYPLVATKNASAAWDMAHDRMKMTNVRFLHLDEFQNATKIANSTEATKILDRLKSMLIDPDYPIVLILSGLPSIATFVQKDIQVARRSLFLEFEPITAEDMGILEAMVDAFAEAANLKPNLPPRDQFLPRLIHAGGSQLGRSIKWIAEAVDCSVLSAHVELTAEHFATAFARRTGNGAAANPFAAPNYAEIDCSRVLLPKIPAAAEPPSQKQKPRKRTRIAARDSY